jgi:hypothetical protein
MPLTDYVINVTEFNVSTYRHNIEDTGTGRSEKRYERDMHFQQERNMSGEPMEAKPAGDMSRLRQFVTNHLAHLKDAKAVTPMLSEGHQLFVRLDGKLYHVRRSYASSPLELPVVVSEATVVDAT